MFERLDANGDGVIDRQELDHMATRASPDVRGDQGTGHRGGSYSPEDAPAAVAQGPDVVELPGSVGAAHELGLEQLPRSAEESNDDFEIALRLAMKVTERLERSLKATENKLRLRDDQNVVLQDAVTELTAALDQIHGERGLTERELGIHLNESAVVASELNEKMDVLKKKMAVSEVQKAELARHLLAAQQELAQSKQTAQVEQAGLTSRLLAAQQDLAQSKQTALECEATSLQLQSERDGAVQLMEDLRCATSTLRLDYDALREANEALCASLEEAREAVFSAVVEKNALSNQLVDISAEHQATIDALESARSAPQNGPDEGVILAAIAATRNCTDLAATGFTQNEEESKGELEGDNGNKAWSRWLYAEAREAVRHNGERNALIAQLDRISAAAASSQAEFDDRFALAVGGRFS